MMIGSSPPYQCLFSKSPTSPEPAKEFTETDTIYAHVTLKGLAKGDHVLEGVWYRPNGVRQAVAKVPFVSKPGEPNRLFTWLKFEVPVRPFDFLGIMERETWRVKLAVDGQPLGEKEFMVWR